MNKEFHQSVWNEELEQDWLRILALAVREDLGSQGDCTTEALVPEQARGRAAIVVRQPACWPARRQSPRPWPNSALVVQASRLRR